MSERILRHPDGPAPSGGTDRSTEAQPEHLFDDAERQSTFTDANRQLSDPVDSLEWSREHDFGLNQLGLIDKSTISGGGNAFTLNGVTFTPTGDGGVHITGTTQTSRAFYYFINKLALSNTWMKPGERYHVKYRNDKVLLGVWFSAALSPWTDIIRSNRTDGVGGFSTLHDDLLIVPENAGYVIVRLQTSTSGVTLDETVYPAIYRDDAIVTPDVLITGNDLNAYQTPGNYQLPDGETASALLHCPSDFSFMMDVERIPRENTFVQLLTSNFVRGRYNSLPAAYMRALQFANDGKLNYTDWHRLGFYDSWKSVANGGTSAATPEGALKRLGVDPLIHKSCHIVQKGLDHVSFTPYRYVGQNLHIWDNVANCSVFTGDLYHLYGHTELYPSNGGRVCGNENRLKEENTVSLQNLNTQIQTLAVNAEVSVLDYVALPKWMIPGQSCYIQFSASSGLALNVRFYFDPKCVSSSNPQPDDLLIFYDEATRTGSRYNDRAITADTLITVPPDAYKIGIAVYRKSAPVDPQETIEVKTLGMYLVSPDSKTDYDMTREYPLAMNQARIGVKVNRRNLRPGDLCYESNSGNSGATLIDKIHHVMMYIGNGYFVQSGRTYGINVSKFSAIKNSKGAGTTEYYGFFNRVESGNELLTHHIRSFDGKVILNIKGRTAESYLEDPDFVAWPDSDHAPINRPGDTFQRLCGYSYVSGNVNMVNRTYTANLNEGHISRNHVHDSVVTVPLGNSIVLRGIGDLCDEIVFDGEYKLIRRIGELNPVDLDFDDITVTNGDDNSLLLTINDVSVKSESSTHAPHMTANFGRYIDDDILTTRNGKLTVILPSTAIIQGQDPRDAIIQTGFKILYALKNEETYTYGMDDDLPGISALVSSLESFRLQSGENTVFIPDETGITVKVNDVNTLIKNETWPFVSFDYAETEAGSDFLEYAAQKKKKRSGSADDRPRPFMLPQGYMYYNTSTHRLEMWDGSNWQNDSLSE